MCLHTMTCIIYLYLINENTVLFQMTSIKLLVCAFAIVCVSIRQSMAAPAPAPQEENYPPMPVCNLHLYFWRGCPVFGWVTLIIERFCILENNECGWSRLANLLIQDEDLVVYELLTVGPKRLTNHITFKPKIYYFFCFVRGNSSKITTLQSRVNDIFI